MTAPNDHIHSGAGSSPGDFDNTAGNWPLKFLRHDFSSQCFNTRDCTISYANFPHHWNEPQGPWQSYGDDHKNFFQSAELSIANFPSPAVLDWISKDGSAHHAIVDMAEIFRDLLIRHKVPRDEVKEGVSIGNPTIALEVDDRTVNVYMIAHIPTKHLQIPGNKYSDFRSDMIKVYSKTY